MHSAVGGRAGGDDRFEAVFNRKEWDVQRRRQLNQVMGAFVVFCVAVVAVSMVCDYKNSHTSREILLREAKFEVSKLVQTKSKQGGLKALSKFANRLATLAEVSPAANTTATSEDGADGKEEEGKPASDSSSIATDAPDRRPPGVMQPGWGHKSSWGAEDWTIWILLGPLVTIIAVVFMYYMYGWQAALSLCVVLLVVDIVAFYLNV